MREFIRIFDDGFNSLVIADVECFSYDRGYLAYDFPNSLTNGQLFSILADILEQSSDCLIIGESSGRGEYVVLKKSNCRMSYLCGEVSGLAFSKAEVLLAVLEYHFDGPAHCINLIRFVEVKRSVCCKDATPWGILAASHIKQAHSHIFNERIHNNIMTAVPAAVFHALGLGGTFADDSFGRKLVTILTERESHALFAHFNHTQIMTFDSSCLDKPNCFLARKPTVSQKVIEPISVLDGSADHIFEQFNLALDIILHAFGCGAILVALLLKPAVEFGRRHGMIAALARFSNKLEINYHLALTIANGKHQRLESKYHLMSNMAKNTTNLLGMHSSFGIIGIINDTTDRMPGMVSANRHLAPKLSGDMVHDFAPIKIVVVDKPIKHVFRRTA